MRHCWKWILKMVEKHLNKIQNLISCHAPGNEKNAPKQKRRKIEFSFVRIIIRIQSYFIASSMCLLLVVLLLAEGLQHQWSVRLTIGKIDENHIEINRNTI